MSAIDLEVTRITPLQQAEIGMRAWKIRAETAEAEVERLHLELERHQVTGDYEMGQHHANAALQAEVERLRAIIQAGDAQLTRLVAENERLRAALTEITDLDLEGDASLADAIAIADEALNPPPDTA